MVIEKAKDRDDFTFTFEPHFDERERRREGLVDSHEFAVMVCNSIDADFEYVSEDAYANITLYNSFTGDYYVITNSEAQNFFKEIPITLTPCKYVVGVF